MRFSPERLKKLVSRILVLAGCADEEAKAIGDHLVEANLAGHDSHGVIRLPIYLKWMRDEIVYAGRNLETVVDAGSMAVADAHRGFGQWIGKQAVALGIEKSREHGVALIALRNSGHLGRIGAWAEEAAEAGLISLHFVNTSGLGMFVVPAGGRDARLSINPFCAGIPVEGRSPIILDVALAATAEGKLKVARNRGERVADDTILDANGDPTNDPNDFYGSEGDRPVGAILPMGSGAGTAAHKGSGLALIVEILAGALTGGGCSAQGKTLMEQNMLSIYVDPAKLGDPGPLFEDIRRYVDFVRTSRPVDPEGSVLLPGEIEDQRRQVRRRGLELDEKTWGQIAKAARSIGVSQYEIEAVAMMGEESA